MRAILLGAVVVLAAAVTSWAGQIQITYVSEVAFDQPMANVYVKDMTGQFLPAGTEGYLMPGLLDTGAAAHVMYRYLADIMEMPVDPDGVAEVLTMCGEYEYLDLSEKVLLGIGPIDSENEADYVEVGPHRVVVHRTDPALAELMGLPMIVGTPFFRDYSAVVTWQMVEIWPGIVLPQLTTTPRPVGTPGPATDLDLPVTPYGETNYDPEPPLPTADGVPFADVVLWKGPHREHRQFIVDTGAQISFISSDLALALGVDLENPDGEGLPVVGAGSCNDITIYPYYLDQLILPTRQGVSLVFQVPLIYVMDVPGIDGGIGSNLLFSAQVGDPLEGILAIDAVDLDLHHGRIGLKMSVAVPPAGELTGDGIVDVIDLLTLIDSFGAAAGSPLYSEQADIDSDGLVDVLDLLQLVSDFGKTTPPPPAAAPPRAAAPRVTAGSPAHIVPSIAVPAAFAHVQPRPAP